MKTWAFATLAILLAPSIALAATHPSRLAEQVGSDPEATSPDCAAAKADALAWDENQVGKTLGRVGRIAVWPFGESRAKRKGEEKNEARELVMERLRLACFTQPPLSFAPKVSGQRWPGGKGYDKQGGFDVIVGGREIAARVHPTAGTILVRARGGGPGSYLWTEEAWARTVAWAIAPAGCGVTDVERVGELEREVAYSCPAGTDLRRLLATGSPLIRRGSWPNPRP